MNALGESTVSNRTGPLLSEHSKRPAVVDQVPASFSQDPHLYLQWRQQKHKSSRSAYPNHEEQLLNQKQIGSTSQTLRAKAARLTKKADPGSRGSSQSQRGTPLACLSEVKNPQSLITFRFVNRNASTLCEIERFRNLTELDVSGNNLVNEVKELMRLPFLKKLNLASNSISKLWALPHTIEILNLSQNDLRRLSVEVMAPLCNIVTLDISENGLQTLDGIGSLQKLRRLIANRNQIQILEPLRDMKSLVELDLEGNPISVWKEVLLTVLNKKDILMLNLRSSPLMAGSKTYQDCINKASLEVMEELLKSSELQLKQVEEFKILLGWLEGEVFYRSKRAYLKIKQHYLTDQKAQYVSNDSSENRKGLSPLQSLAGNPGNSRPSFNYEALDSLYDKLLEDEDKILLLKKKREESVRKRQRQQPTKQQMSEESDKHSSACESEDSDLLDQSLSDQSLDDLKNSYQIEHPPISGAKDFLNESTADFNKAIKQINMQLKLEGHLDQGNIVLSIEKEEQLRLLNSLTKNSESLRDSIDKVIDAHTESEAEVNMNEINVQIPRDERTTGKIVTITSKSPEASRRVSQFSTQRKAPISFKLDLSKCTQEQQNLPVPVVDFTKLLDADRPEDECDSPSKSYDMQKSPQRLKLSGNAPIVVKKQISGQTQLPVSLKPKQIIIPRLALQDLQRHSSDCSSLTKVDPSKPREASVVHTKPKNLKMLSSKRESSCEATELAKALSANHDNELDDLKAKFTQQSELIKAIKGALGNEFLPDRELVLAIQSLRTASVQEMERYQMTIEDLTARIIQLEELGKQHASKNEVVEREGKRNKNYPEDLETKLQALKNRGGLTLRVKNIRQNESLVDIAKGFSTMFEIKTGRLPVVASHNHDLSLPSGQVHNESLIRNFRDLDGSRNEKSAIEDINLENSIDPTELVVSQLLQKQFYAKEMVVSLSDESELELSNDQTEDFERATSPLLTYEHTDTVKGRKQMAILPQDTSNPASKHAYFDRAKPILNLQEQRAIRDKESAENYMMEIDQTIATSALNKTARERYGQDSDGATKKVGIYLEKMRERNSSLQERLNLSFKSSSRLDESSVVKRPGTSLQNVKWIDSVDGSKCKSLNRSTAISKIDPSRPRNKVNLSVIRRKDSSQEEQGDPSFRGRIPRIQLTQRADSNFINLGSFRLNLRSIDTRKQSITPNDPVSHYETELLRQPHLTNYFTSRDQKLDENDQVKSAANPRVEREPIQLKLQTSETTALANFYQCTKVLEQLSKTSRPAIVKLNDGRNKSGEFNSISSYGSLLKQKDPIQAYEQAEDCQAQKSYWTQGLSAVESSGMGGKSQSKRTKTKIQQAASHQRQKKQGALTVRNTKQVSGSFDLSGSLAREERF